MSVHWLGPEAATSKADFGPPSRRNSNVSFSQAGCTIYYLGSWHNIGKIQVIPERATGIMIIKKNNITQIIELNKLTMERVGFNDFIHCCSLIMFVFVFVFVFWRKRKLYWVNIVAAVTLTITFLLNPDHTYLYNQWDPISGWKRISEKKDNVVSNSVANLHPNS